MRFTVRRRVEFCDTDMAGIVHFANFFRYMESAEHDFLRSRGLAVIDAETEDGIGFPRVAANCDYLAPARYEDVLDIEVSLERVGDKSVTYMFDIRSGSEPIAKGRITTVCCRRTADGFDSISIPDEYRKKLLS